MMKKIRVVLWLVVLTIFSNYDLMAQVNQINSTLEKRQPSFVAVNENMAVNLLFPYPIKRAQWVSADISVQQFKGVENILLIKANKKDFPLTNVSVVTTDGRFYSFVIGYASQLTTLNIDCKTSFIDPVATFVSDKDYNEVSYQKLAQIALKDRSDFGAVKNKKYGVKLLVDGIFISQNAMFFRLKIKNSTNIQYDIDQLRFYIRDEKKAKRTASQEVELLPSYSYLASSVVGGKSERTTIYAFKKFTIPDNKYLAVEILEKNGGRNLQLKVVNNKIIQAKSI